MVMNFFRFLIMSLTRSTGVNWLDNLGVIAGTQGSHFDGTIHCRLRDSSLLGSDEEFLVGDVYIIR